MQGHIGTFLLIEKGEPYQPGEAIPLTDGTLLLGRRWADHLPDIPFNSSHVSRRHARINCVQGLCSITDLPSSRHGTFVNGRKLVKEVPCKLGNGDRVELAKGAVVLIFCSGEVLGETADYPSEEPNQELRLDQDRREVIADGRALRLSGKLYELFLLLWSSSGRVVDHNTIRKTIWPERALDHRGVPLVGEEEITALVYRLRGQLGKYGSLIRTVRGHGYLLDRDV